MANSEKGWVLKARNYTFFVILTILWESDKEHRASSLYSSVFLMIQMCKQLCLIDSLIRWYLSYLEKTH